MFQILTMPSLARASKITGKERTKSMKSFFHVFFIEWIQNLASIVGLVLALTTPGWGGYGMVIGGMLITSIVIALTENWKLSATELPQELQTLWGTLQYGLLLGGFGCLYLFLSQWGDWRIHLVIGLVLGGALSAISFSKENWWTPRFWSHTASFSATGGVLLLLFRIAKDATSTSEKSLHIVTLTTVMTLLIVVIDYGPFLKKKP